MPFEIKPSYMNIRDGDNYVPVPGLGGKQGESGHDGEKGSDGLNGTTFTPHVSSEGDLSWSNADGKVNPETVNIKGPEGKSAYQTAVDGGFDGTEAEFEEYLSGIGDLSDELAVQKRIVDDLTALTNRKAGMLVDSASGSIASFVPDSTIDNLLGVSVDIEPVQAGSGDPSTDNVRPISGWDSVEVEATGINVWDEEWEAGGISDTTGEKITQSSRIRSKNYIPCVPNTSYCLVSPLTSNDVRIAYYRADFSFISMTPWTVNGAFTTNASAHYMMFLTAGAYGNTYHNDISINYPSTDTAYHPYAGNRYTIALGQTVYGGTLDVAEDGTATVSMTIVKEVYDGSDDEGWVLISDGTTSRRFRMVTTGFAALFSSSTFKKTSDTSNVWGTCVLASSYITLNDKDSSIADVSALRTWLAENKPEFAYVLSTPITITLDPVTISTISGQTNNVWATTGDVSVKFAADLKHYIDSKIAAAVAALS